MVAMMPVFPAFEGVENQQADKQGQNDQREIEDGRRIAENLVEDVLGVTAHTASAQYPQPPPMPFAVAPVNGHDCANAGAQAPSPVSVGIARGWLHHS
jgi:hypothetical protein